MWTVIYVSQSLQTARRLTEALGENGVITKLRKANAHEDDNTGCYEVLVPSAEMEAAQDVIIENGLF